MSHAFENLSSLFGGLRTRECIFHFVLMTQISHVHDIAQQLQVQLTCVVVPHFAHFQLDQTRETNPGF